MFQKHVDKVMENNGAINVDMYHYHQKMIDEVIKNTNQNNEILADKIFERTLLQPKINNLVEQLTK